MSTLVPESVLGLPPPWNDLRNRWDVDTHARAPDALTSAFSALERCLAGHRQLPGHPAEALPEDLEVGFGIASLAIAEEMPRPEDFDPAVIERHYGKLSEDLLQLYAEFWLDRRIISLIKRILRWLVEGYDPSEQRVFTELSAIVSGHWPHVDFVVSLELVSALERMDPMRARPVLEEVAKDPGAPPQLRDYVEGLVRMIDAAQGRGRQG